MHILFRHILTIIDAYSGEMPLHLYIKQFFASNKKLGARDRKVITEGVYLVYRWEPFYENASWMDILQMANSKGYVQHPLLKSLLEKENGNQPIDAHEQIPALLPLSDGITETQYFQHFLHQPKVFFRLMQTAVPISSMGDIVSQVAEIAAMPVFATDAGTPIQQYLDEKTYVIQDLNSQKCIAEAVESLGDTPINAIWDICSGAGGKTILLRQLFPKATIFATDIRGNILKNLQHRMRAYGLDKVQTAVADVHLNIPDEIPVASVHLFVADVPCSGSGTWARTPESLSFWKSTDIELFVKRQKGIVENVITSMPSGAYLLYITCSVFKAENEDVVHHILLQKKDIQLLQMHTLTGIEQQSDHMFYALLQKN